MPTAASTVTGLEVQYLIAKMNRAAPFLPFSKPNDVPFQDRSTRHTSTTQAPPKHIQQVESITNHIKEANFFHPGTSFCELGCGTAKLSDHISQAMDGCASHVLIDRKVFGKTSLRDGAMMARLKRGNSVRRITMDIGDIDDLSSICGPNPVVISKHLCGIAADHLIRCCCRSRAPLIVATCCHYLCDWDQFSNTRFFEMLGFSQRDFQVLTIISQWASIGKDCSFEAKSSNEGDGSATWTILPSLELLSSTIIPEHLVDSDDFERSFSRPEKMALGKRCKLFLDTARAYRLQEVGYQVKLVRYTTMSIEDHLLMAVPKNFSS